MAHSAAREPARGRTFVRARRRNSMVVVLPVAYFVFTLLLIALHQGRLVTYLYPAGAFIVALYLYVRSPVHYLGFVCWLFFLSAEVRRLADFVNGAFSPKSLIMIAPMIALALCGLSLIKNINSLGERRCAPLVLIVISLVYAFFVGMVRVGPAPALFTLVNWLSPVLVGLHLAVTWQHYPDYHRVLLKTCVYGGLVMGVYGVYQYVQPPPWDVFWLIQSQMVTEGKPVPFGLRVMSTMNSSGPFAATMVYTLLMGFATRGWTRLFMMLFGVAALLFTSVRTGWGGFAIGLIYPFMTLDGKSRMRFVAALVGIAVLCVPVLMNPQISGNVLKRINTISDISQDHSYQSRMLFYDYFMETALTDISGQGLGTTGMGVKLADSSSGAPQSVAFDSGVMEVPFVMGWPGTPLYVGGVLMLLWRAFVASRLRPHDRFAVCGVGVAIAILAMMVMVNTLISVPGVIFFICVMMPVIGLRYSREMARRAARVSTASTGSTGSTAPQGAPPLAAARGTP